MTDIEQKALALVNEIERERGEDELTPRIMRGLIIDEALCRAIEQHEATKQELQDFKQKVSDTAQRAIDSPNKTLNVKWALSEFIIPAPKPDPLVEALEATFAASGIGSANMPKSCPSHFKAALKARGLEIRSKNDD